MLLILLEKREIYCNWFTNKFHFIIEFLLYNETNKINYK